LLKINKTVQLSPLFYQTFKQWHVKKNLSKIIIFRFYFSLGDGVQYPVRTQQSYESMGDTQPRLLDNSVAIQIPTERLVGNGHTTFDASNVALTKVEIGKATDNNVIV
jgi:hypothetical protein